MNLPAGAERRSSRAPIDGSSRAPIDGSSRALVDRTRNLIAHHVPGRLPPVRCRRGPLHLLAGEGCRRPARPARPPCGRAAKALDDAGHQYEIKQVKGGSLRFWTWPSRAKDRAEVERLSGQRGVPILVLDSGEVISGSGDIASWARTNEAVA
jgi:hypothetical protein